MAWTLPLLLAIQLAPTGLMLRVAPEGRCEVRLGAAGLTLPTACGALRIRKALGGLPTLDVRHDDRTERLFLQAVGERLAVVLRRDVRVESLPIEESGDTLIETATFSLGPLVGGLPVIIEARRREARQFNQVDRVGQDAEVQTTHFAFDGTAYRPLTAP